MNHWDEYTIFKRTTIAKGGTCYPGEPPPIDEFTCRLCGYSLQVPQCGVYAVGLPTHSEKAQERMHRHICDFHRDEVLSMGGA